ncbi:MAG: pirin family protein [Deltaproteobacteria bacterium]|nr:pirin family protein [Deltaproteobacteria bacterium]
MSEPAPIPGRGAVELIIPGRARGVGNIEVARLIPVAARRAVGPFVFLDHMGPVALPPGQRFDVLPHPHIGLSTVTYLFDGAVMHRDSIGSVQLIRAGEINLMTAGRGVAHSERTPEESLAQGQTMHGLQFWLGLPAELEDCEPGFWHHAREEFPALELDGAHLRVLIGAWNGRASPVQHPTSPTLVEIALTQGGTFTVTSELAECALYVVSGAIEVEGEAHATHTLLIRAHGQSFTARALTDSKLVLLGGPPLDGRKHMDWNFVSSSLDKITAAKAAWKARTWPKIPGDDQEFVPYPSAR